MIAIYYYAPIFWLFLIVRVYPLNVSCFNHSAVFLSSRFDGKISFGMPIPLSGLHTRRFDIIKQKINGLEMYQRWVNSCLGGLKVGTGLYFIDTVVVDDQSNLTVTLSKVAELVEEHGVIFLFPSFSPELESVGLQYAEEHKIITMMETGVSFGCPGYEYCYSVRSLDSEMMSSIIKALALRGARKVAYFYMDEPAMREICEGIPKSIENLPANLNGVEIVYHNSTYSTYMGLGEHMKANTDRIDILIGCILDADQFIQEVDMVGIDPKALIFPRCVAEGNCVANLGKDARYLLGPTQFDEQMDYLCHITGLTPATFGDTYRWLFGQDHLVTGAATFAGALALGQAVVNAGTLDSDEVKYALSRLDIDTFFGKIKFNSVNMASNEMVFQQIDEELNTQIVIPDAVATDSLIYPMPLWSYRSCIDFYGVGSCECEEAGCPSCTAADYEYAVSACETPSGKRYIQFKKRESSDCTGGSLIPQNIPMLCDYVALMTNTATKIISASAVVGFIALIFFLWVLRNRRHEVIKHSQPAFCILFTLFGGVFGCSTILFLGRPTPIGCLLQLWVFHLSFTGMVGSLFVKIFRIWKVFGAQPFQKVKITAKMMLKALSGLIFVDAMLLLVVTLNNPPVPRTKMIEIAQFSDIPSIECKNVGNHISGLILYEVAILLVGCYFSFQIRHVPSDFSETKFIMFALYSVALVLGSTLLVVLFGQHEVCIQFSLELQAYGVSFSTIMALSCVLLPKVLACHNKVICLTYIPAARSEEIASSQGKQTQSSSQQGRQAQSIQSTFENEEAKHHIEPKSRIKTSSTYRKVFSRETSSKCSKKIFAINSPPNKTLFEEEKDGKYYFQPTI